jgi:signal peptidase I
MIERKDLKDLRPGDIIAFLVKGKTAMMAHRLIKKRFKAGELTLITKGDNNAYLDEAVAPERVVGRVSRAKKENGADFDPGAKRIIAAKQLALGNILILAACLKRAIPLPLRNFLRKPFVAFHRRING